MNTCAITRLLIPGAVVGMIVSSVASSDLIGWIAAAVTVTVLLVLQRIRGTASACALQLPDQPTDDDASSDNPASKVTSPN